MTRELITSWSDYQTAIDRLLAIATHSVCIYDEDLALLHLESGNRDGHLERLLNASRADTTVRIALRNADPLRRQHPRLMNLLASHGHRLIVQQTPPQLAHLRDSMILVDDKHGLIRFERDMPRSKLLIDECDELKPYHTRFAELWAESNERISPTVLGL